MKVEIYSREAIKELMKGEFPKNTAVISFCSPRKTRRAEEVRVYFGNVCDRVFNILIPDIDIEILGDYGYTYETYLAGAVFDGYNSVDITHFNTVLSNISSKI